MSKTAPVDKDSKYFRELRKQIMRLKKENAALRKKINSESDLESESEAMLEIIDMYERERAEKIQKSETRCPQCDSVVSKFELRGGEYYKCHNCGSKGKIVAAS